MSEYPLQKIARYPNGIYHWSCSIDVDYYRHGMMNGVKACIGIAVFLLIFGGFLAVTNDDLESFFIVLASTAVFGVICAGVFIPVIVLVKDPGEHFEMCDDWVKSGSGKSSVYFNYKGVRTLAIHNNWLELRGKVKKVRIYAPPEDFGFVRDYVKYRIPGEANITYE